jgi:hypothetical protein
MEYTAKETLEIRGSRIYAVSYLVMTLLATGLQIIGKTPVSDVIPTFTINMLVAGAGYLVYRRRMAKKSVLLLVWLTAMLTVSINCAVRYMYVRQFDWLYSAQSIHIYGVQIFTLIMLQYFYNKKLYIVFFVVSLVNWLLLIGLAHTIGAFPCRLPAGRWTAVSRHYADPRCVLCDCDGHCGVCLVPQHSHNRGVRRHVQRPSLTPSWPR